jgi:hypothetical protein
VRRHFTQESHGVGGVSQKLEEALAPELRARIAGHLRATMSASAKARRRWPKNTGVRFEHQGPVSGVHIEQVPDLHCRGGTKRWMVCPRCGRLAQVVGYRPGPGHLASYVTPMSLAPGSACWKLDHADRFLGYRYEGGRKIKIGAIQKFLHAWFWAPDLSVHWFGPVASREEAERRLLQEHEALRQHL